MTEDVRAAREQARQRRPEAMALARAMRAGQVEPAVRYYCPVGASRGRGGCLMLSIYSTPHGPLLYRPPLRKSETVAERTASATRTEKFAELLADTIASAGGATVSGLAECRHYVAAVTTDLLESDFERRAGDVVLDRDTPEAMYHIGPRIAR